MCLYKRNKHLKKFLNIFIYQLHYNDKKSLIRMFQLILYTYKLSLDNQFKHIRESNSHKESDSQRNPLSKTLLWHICNETKHKKGIKWRKHIYYPQCVIKLRKRKLKRYQSPSKFQIMTLDHDAWKHTSVAWETYCSQKYGEFRDFPINCQDICNKFLSPFQHCLGIFQY